MTRVDVHKWVTMSGGVLPQGGGIQLCRLLTLRSMYDSWHTVPDQLCSICLVVEVGATAPCVSRRIWRSHAWPRATSSPTPSPTHTSTSARRDCARRRARHGGDPLEPSAKGRRTTNDGCAAALMSVVGVSGCRLVRPQGEGLPVIGCARRSQGNDVGSGERSED